MQAQGIEKTLESSYEKLPFATMRKVKNQEIKRNILEILQINSEIYTDNLISSFILNHFKNSDYFDHISTLELNKMLSPLADSENKANRLKQLNSLKKEIYKELLSKRFYKEAILKSFRRLKMETTNFHNKIESILASKHGADWLSLLFYISFNLCNKSQSNCPVCPLKKECKDNN